MIIKKSIYTIAMIIAISFSPAKAIWKYLTTGYWNEKKEFQNKQKLQKQIYQNNEIKLTKYLKGDDLYKFHSKLYDQKINNLTIEINRLAKLQNTNIFSIAYWFPYTYGNQFKIDQKTIKRNNLIERSNKLVETIKRNQQNDKLKFKMPQKNKNE